MTWMTLPAGAGFPTVLGVRAPSSTPSRPSGSRKIADLTPKPPGRGGLGCITPAGPSVIANPQPPPGKSCSRSGPRAHGGHRTPAVYRCKHSACPHHPLQHRPATPPPLKAPPLPATFLLASPPQGSPQGQRPPQPGPHGALKVTPLTSHAPF